MSLKNANNPSAFSIKYRLAFFYSVSVFVLLALIAVFLYWQMMNVLHKADYQFLDNQVEDIQELLEANQHNSIDTTLKKVVIEDPLESTNIVYRYFIRVFDQDGHIQLETPGMGDIVSAAQMPYEKEIKYLWYDKNKTHYLLAQHAVAMPDGGFKHVQVMLDVSSQHGFVSDRKRLGLYFLAAVISAILLGIFIANRGLRSLYMLTKMTENITIHSLDQRINPASWPVELRGVALSFNHMLTRINSAIEQLKQFSGDLAHDMRIPITNLIGESELALSREMTNEKYRDVLSSHLEELQRLSRLIDGLLFLARSESPQFSLQLSKLDAAAEIRAMSDYFSAVADEKSIDVIIEGNAYLMADMMMFRRVINNLLSNALKFTPAKGSVRIILQDKNEGVFIDIVDSGVGIEASHLPKLFNRFYRIDASRNQATGGHGLGLPIVKSIVNLHKGTISIESTPGVGTKVSLFFPT